MNTKLALLALVLVAVVLVSGCAQGEQKKTSRPTQSPAQTAVATPTPTPYPTQVSVSGDVIGAELAKSDSIETDVSDSDLDSLNSDLGEVENGL